MCSAKPTWMSSSSTSARKQSTRLAPGSPPAGPPTSPPAESATKTPARLDGRLRGGSDDALLADCDLIWEAATERVDVKQAIFAQIERTVDPESLAAIFSNTSSHTTGELAALFHREAFREKLLTVHGYYPFEQNRLLDVIEGPFASSETFAFGVAFAEQLLEKTVLALPVDHHGYVTDPIFQAMGAIVSWDVRSGADLTVLPAVWELFTANPFNVLDRTGHMPYTEWCHHLARRSPKTIACGRCTSCTDGIIPSGSSGWKQPAARGSPRRNAAGSSPGAKENRPPR